MESILVSSSLLYSNYSLVMTAELPTMDRDPFLTLCCGAWSLSVRLAFGDGMAANIKHTQMLRIHFCDVVFPSVPETHQE